MSQFELPPVSVTNDLLRTRLTPPRLHSALVSRPALLARLDEALSRKLTVISAPAGFGKTTLAAEWLSARGSPAAWVSLDAGENDPIRFWRYVITACRVFDAEIGLSALAFFARSDLAGAGQTLAGALEIGRARGFRRVFLDEGEPMAALLRSGFRRL